MVEQLFTVGRGFAIETDEGLSNVYEEFVTDGVPSNASLTPEELTLSDNAPVGSKCIDSATGLEYRKKTAGAGETTWVRNASVDDIALANNGESWREPADVKDDTTYTNLASAETALNTGQLDGVAIVEGNRILFTDITGANKNVFIVTGTPGSGATLVEDTNAPSHNDTLMINKGTSADNEFHYNDVSSSWVNSGANGSNEDGFQNVYLGKPTLGSSLPQYTSQNKIANNDNLTVAVGKLDAEALVQATNHTNQNITINGISTAVNAIETSLGNVGGDGVYVPRTTSNYIDANATIDEDLTDLDTQIKANADAILATGGANTSNGVTAITPVDEVLVDDIKMVRWMVHVQQGTKVTTFEVDATHDGTTGADASNVDFTKYARLKIGGNIAGLRVNCALNGSGATQEMQVRVKANASVDVSTTRLQVI